MEKYSIEKIAAAERELKITADAQKSVDLMQKIGATGKGGKSGTRPPSPRTSRQLASLSLEEEEESSDGAEGNNDNEGITLREVFNESYMVVMDAIGDSNGSERIVEKGRGAVGGAESDDDAEDDKDDSNNGDLNNDNDNAADDDNYGGDDSDLSDDNGNAIAEKSSSFQREQVHEDSPS